jgi:signal transduction histidine kinase
MTALTPRSRSAAGPLAVRLGGRRLLTVLPWAAVLAESSLVAAALTLAALNQVTIQASLSEFFVVAVSAALSFGVVGPVIALKRPDLRIGWLLCAVAVATSIPPFTAQYARYAVVTHPGVLPAGRLAAWLTVWDWPVGYTLVLVGVALFFPDVPTLDRRERLVAWLAAVAAALMMAGNAVSLKPNQALPEVPNPYALAGAGGLGFAGQAIGTLTLLAAMIAAFALLAGRYRHGSERQRQQLRWFLFAFAALTVVEILGDPCPVVLRLPLAFGPEQVGELAVAARRPGEQLSAADRRLLADFARQAGMAAHAVRLTTDLQAARERLVTAREEERRRLRRDLHDGLGPHLASQALTLDAARDLLHKDPAAADSLLAELRGQTQQAVADIRRVVNDLRPPALDDRGLVEALREHAARYAGTGLQVCIAAPGQLPPLPAAVDLAAYRIAAEAVTNTARHAAARRCTISLTADAGPGLVTLEVRDDGCGLPASYLPGLGLASMKARASELGGRCRIEGQPGAGTLVVAELPFDRDAL